MTTNATTQATPKKGPSYTPPTQQYHVRGSREQRRFSHLLKVQHGVARLTRDHKDAIAYFCGGSEGSIVVRGAARGRGVTTPRAINAAVESMELTTS